MSTIICVVQIASPPRSGANNPSGDERYLSTQDLGPWKSIGFCFQPGARNRCCGPLWPTPPNASRMALRYGGAVRALYYEVHSIAWWISFRRRISSSTPKRFRVLVARGRATWKPMTITIAWASPVCALCGGIRASLVEEDGWPRCRYPRHNPRKTALGT